MRHICFLSILFVILMISPELCLARLTEEERDLHETYKRQDERFWGKHFSKLFNDKTFNKSYALVIGLSDYSEWSTLESPYHDALKVRDHLINDAGFDYVVTLTNREATKRKINRYMEEIFPGMIRDKDRFLFYYSGHGTQRVWGDRIRGYLPMLDSEKETWGDMLNMDDIERWNQNVHQAKHALFVLDCCFSGLAGTQKKGDGQKLYLEDLSKYGHHLITAGTADQESYGSLTRWGGSLFTNAFISGISGKADAGSDDFPKEGVVSLTELEEYIKKRVKDATAEIKAVNQSPQISDLGGSEGEFFFITDEKRLDSLVTDQGKRLEHGWPVEVKSEGTVEGKEESQGIYIPPPRPWWHSRPGVVGTSLLVPGLGHHLRGNHVRGWIYEGTTVGTGALALWAYNQHQKTRDDYVEIRGKVSIAEQNEARDKADSARTLALVTQITFGVVWAANVLDAGLAKPEELKRPAVEVQPTPGGGRVLVRVPF